MTIRRAAVEDANLLATLNESVQRLHGQGRPDLFRMPGHDEELTIWYRDTIEQVDNHVFIAEAAGVAVGFMVARILHRPQNAFALAQKSLFVDQLCVVDGQQGKGFGSRLMEAAYALAQEEGIQRVMLDVWSFNGKALEFYEKQGFGIYNLRLEKFID